MDKSHTLREPSSSQAKTNTSIAYKIALCLWEATKAEAFGEPFGVATIADISRFHSDRARKEKLFLKTGGYSPISEQNDSDVS